MIADISSQYKEIVRDETALAILLELGTQQKISFPDLQKNLPIGEEILKIKLDLLEKTGFIKQNPSSDEFKPYSERKYLLSLKGIFLLNKIRYSFPEYVDSFNFFF